MNYERERQRAEAHAKAAVAEGNWRMAAYNLFNASRMTLRLSDASSGRTRGGFTRLARRYEAWGDEALDRANLPSSSEACETSSPSRTDSEDESAESWVMRDRPDVRLDDVAGMHEMKEIIQTHVVLPMKHADVYAEYQLQPGSGVLMYGPPGTGKTFVSQAIAGEVDAAFIPVEMKKVLSKWFGDTERILGELFEAARSYPRSVIFFDEAEALFPKRGANNSSVMARVVPQLLQLINGLDPTKNCVILLGATNRPWLMDEAATRPGRFGRLVYVGPPDAEARARMIERSMKDAPKEALDYEALAIRTEGYSGADLSGDRDSVCVEAKLAALKRTLAGSAGTTTENLEPEVVTMSDFEAALERVTPSISGDDLRKFEEFAQANGRV